MLLSRDADPLNISLERHSNLLFAAVQSECPRIVSLILARKCVDIEAEGGFFGLTALRTATLLLHVEIILLLVEATTDAASARFSRRVAELVQTLPFVLRCELDVQLWDMQERWGWEAVQGKMIRFLEDAEAAGQVADLSMENVKGGATDVDGCQDAT